MQTKFTQLTVLVFMLAMLTFSCKKKEDEKPVDTQNSCQITSSVSGTSEVKFEYDGAGKLTKISFLDNTAADGAYTLAYGTDGLATKINLFATVVTSSPDGYYTLTHDAKGNIATSSIYLKNTSGNYVLFISVSFEYDSNNLITKEIYSSGYYRYEYNTNQNVTKVFSKSSSGAEILETEYTSYDDKVNPISANKYINLVFNSYGNSKNNVLEEKSYNSGTLEGTTTTSYNYNDKGLPISSAITYKPVTGSTQTGSSTYTYVCK